LDRRRDGKATPTEKADCNDMRSDRLSIAKPLLPHS